MNYYTIPPPASLKPYVRFFWVLENCSGGYTHRSMAEVCSEMVFHYKGRFDELFDSGKTEQSFLSGVQGPSEKIRRFTIGESFGIFGVYFYPYSIPLLTRISAPELSDRMIDLQTLLGKEGSELEERIMLALNNDERITIMTEFLERRFTNVTKPHPVFASIDHIISTKGVERIETLADRFAVSERQFERKFREWSGLSPKLFSRIVRFHAACAEFGNTDKSLADIAYDTGYYDQSHFIRDFKHFSGHHPKTYFYGHAEGTGWRQ